MLFASCANEKSGPTQKELAQMKFPGYTISKDFYFDFEMVDEEVVLDKDIIVFNGLLEELGAKSPIDIEKEGRYIANDSVFMIRKDIVNAEGVDFSVVYWLYRYENFKAYCTAVQTEQLNELQEVFDFEDYEPYALAASIVNQDINKFISFCNIRKNKMRVCCFQLSE